MAAYDPLPHFCELHHAGRRSAHGATILARLDRMGLAELGHRARAAETELYNQGITFTIYSQGDAIDRILPFDVIPRVITAEDWAVIEAGVTQRVSGADAITRTPAVSARMSTTSECAPARCRSTAIERPSGDQRGALNWVSGSERSTVTSSRPIGIVTRSRRPDPSCTATIVLPSGERTGSSSRLS